MIKLIRNEFLKLRHRPIIYIAFAMIFVVIAAYTGLELYNQYLNSQQTEHDDNPYPLQNRYMFVKNYRSTQNR